MPLSGTKVCTDCGETFTFTEARRAPRFCRPCAAARTRRSKAAYVDRHDPKSFFGQVGNIGVCQQMAIRTSKEVGNLLGISPQGVAQLEGRAFSKIRSAYLQLESGKPLPPAKSSSRISIQQAVELQSWRDYADDLQAEEPALAAEVRHEISNLLAAIR